MNADHILKADLLDILFEKRNKDYGAYLLRKGYNQRLYKSLGIAFLLIAIIALLSFFKKEKLFSPYADKRGAELGIAVYEIPKEIPVSPPQVPKPPVTLSIPLSTDHEPVNNNSDAGHLVFSEEAPRISSPVDIGPGLPGEVDPTGGTAPYVPQSPATAAPATPTIDKTIPVSPDVMPSFPGGLNALREFLERNLAQPQNLEPGDEISVKIKFIVGYDGKLRGFEIVEDGGEQYNNEVIRVLKKMPAWIPGKAHGENVSVYYVVPVKFIPQD